MVWQSADVTYGKHRVPCMAKALVAIIVIAACFGLNEAVGTSAKSNALSLGVAEQEISEERAVAAEEEATAAAHEARDEMASDMDADYLPSSVQDGGVEKVESKIDAEILREMEELRDLRASSSRQKQTETRHLMRRQTSSSAGSEHTHHEATALMESEQRVEEGKSKMGSVANSSEKSLETAVPKPGEIPRDIVDSDGICDQMETEIDDDLLGSVIALGRHAPLCHNDHVLKKWSLSRAGTITRIKLKYTCCIGQWIGECRYNNTQWMPAEDNKVTKLTDHRLECYEKMSNLGHEVFVQRGYHLESRDNNFGAPGAKDIRFVYWCCGVTPNGACTNHETTEDSDGRGHVGYVERHELECPKDSGMMMWHMVSQTADRIKFQYRCCPLVPLPSWAQLTSNVIL